MKAPTNILPEHKTALRKALTALLRRRKAQRKKSPAPAPAATAASGNKTTAA